MHMEKLAGRLQVSRDENTHRNRLTFRAGRPSSEECLNTTSTAGETIEPPLTRRTQEQAHSDFVTKKCAEYSCLHDAGGGIPTGASGTYYFTTICTPCLRGDLTRAAEGGRKRWVVSRAMNIVKYHGILF